MFVLVYVLTILPTPKRGMARESGSSIWMESSSIQLSGSVLGSCLEWLKGREGRDPACIGVTGADRGCEGPHDGTPEGRVRTNPVPTSTWPDE